MTKLEEQWTKGLTPQMVKRSQDELGETSFVKATALNELKELINNEPGFCPLMEDGFLLRFLRARKYDVKRSFQTLKNYYEYKYRNTGVTTDLLPFDAKHVLEMDKVLISPVREPSGGGIMIADLGSFDTDLATPIELFAAGFMCAEIGTDTEASQVCGSSLVFDLAGITFLKMKQYTTPYIISRLIRGLQDCWPYRVNGIHIIHEPKTISLIYALLKPMLSKKIKQRVRFHGNNLDNLHKFIPPECLPEQLGGYLTKKDFTDFRSYILGQEQLMIKLNKYIYQGTPSTQKQSQPVQMDSDNGTSLIDDL